MKKKLRHRLNGNEIQSVKRSTFSAERSTFSAEPWISATQAHILVQSWPFLHFVIFLIIWPVFATVYTTIKINA